MDYLLYSHNLIKVNYFIEDPNKIANELLGNILTKDEIIGYIIENGIEQVKIIYMNKLNIKYKINDSTLKICSDNVEGVHLIRLVGKEFLPNYLNQLEILISVDRLMEFLLNMNSILINSNIFAKCTVCGINFDSNGLDIENIIICNSINCIEESKELIINNAVTNLKKKDSILLEFLTMNLLNGIEHPKKDKIFKPLPIIKGISTFDEISNLIKQLSSTDNYIKLMNFIGTEERCDMNDIELIEIIGTKLYALVKNAISENFYSINAITIMREHFNILASDNIDIDDFEKNVKYLKFNYSYEIESKFKKKYFLFHGSPFYAWYPIIKNGLKVMSGTEFQSNGAAYGTGIYFSNSLSFSYNYCGLGSGQISNSDTTLNKFATVGVFEILTDPKKYYKSPNIYVIDNDQIILLRYLIVFKKKFSTKIFDKLTTYFVNYVGNSETLAKANITLTNKRLSNELNKLNKNSNVEQTNIIDENSLWEIQLKNINGINVKLEIHFNDYPILPPRIIINCTCKLNIPQLFDSNNIVILNDLNQSNWTLTTTLSILVDKIYNCICRNI